jgi:hypothetical protein
MVAEVLEQSRRDIEASLTGALNPNWAFKRLFRPSLLEFSTAFIQSAVTIFGSSNPEMLLSTKMYPSPVL